MYKIPLPLRNRLDQFLLLREKESGVKVDRDNYVQLAIQEKMERYRKDGRSK
jgi:hypothetical protein